MENEQGSLFRPPMREYTVMEQLQDRAEQPGLLAENYIWPTRKGAPEDLDAEMARELEALKQLQDLAKFGVTGRDKVILYFSTLHYMLDVDKYILDKPITWQEFRRLFAARLAKYCEGRESID